MRRREFVAAAAAALASSLARAQQAEPRRAPLLGILNAAHSRTPAQHYRTPIAIKLRELGWREGENLQVLRADAQDVIDRLPALASELVNHRVDVIWALGSPEAVAAARATSTIPIVFWGVGWPEEQGLVASLARPGRNVTGVAILAGPEVYAKLVELLRAVAPGAKRLAEIVSTGENPVVAGGELPESVIGVGAAARKLGFELHRIAMRRVEEMTNVLWEVEQLRIEALLVPHALLPYRSRDRLVEFAMRRRLPAAYAMPEYVDAGGLMSYGFHPDNTVVRSAQYVDRVLRGANPAQMPVDRAKEIECVVNLRTAKLMGLRMPQVLLNLADRVIE
jgi:putative ABC transport system substrate-binding protein